jgi:flagellar export protein FliJ
MRGRTFTFKLEPVRRLRKHAELRAMERVAADLAAASALAAEVSAANDRLASARHGAAPVADGADLAQRQAYVERLAGELAAANNRAAAQAEALIGSQAGLAAAAQEREALDRLEQRQRATHAAMLRTSEREVLLDISLARYAPRAGGAA